MRFSVKVSTRNGKNVVKFTDGNVEWYKALVEIFADDPEQSEELVVAKDVYARLRKEEAQVTRALTNIFAEKTRKSADRNASRCFVSICECGGEESYPHPPALGHAFCVDDIGTPAPLCTGCNVSYTSHQSDPRPCQDWIAKNRPYRPGRIE